MKWDITKLLSLDGSLFVELQIDLMWDMQAIQIFVIV